MANVTEEDIYDLGEIRFNDQVVECDSFKIGYSIKNERKTATNSYVGVGWKTSEEEYSWEASDIDLKYLGIMRERWKMQKTDKKGMTISTYNFVEDGDYQEQEVLYECMIESIDVEQGGGATFSVKGEALRAKYKK